jgi:hypothetical protein
MGLVNSVLGEIMQLYANKRLEYIDPIFENNTFCLKNSLTNEIISIVNPQSKVFLNQNNFTYALSSTGIILWYYERHGIIFIDKKSGRILWNRTDIKQRANLGFYYKDGQEFIVAKGTTGPLHIIDPATGIDYLETIKGAWQIYSWEDRPNHIMVHPGRYRIFNQSKLMGEVKFKWDEIKYCESNSNATIFMISDFRSGLHMIIENAIKSFVLESFNMPLAISFIEKLSEFHVIGFNHTDTKRSNCYMRVREDGSIISIETSSNIPGNSHFIASGQRILTSIDGRETLINTITRCPI